MNRGRLIARTAAYMGLSTDNADELLLLQEWAQEGVHEVLIETRCHVDLGDMTLQANVSEYRTDASILAILNDTVVGSSLDFEPITMTEMTELRRSNTYTGSPATYFAIEGNLMVVWPTPSAADVIEFLAVLKPTAMTLDSHDPSDEAYGGIPAHLHRAIEYYMRWQAAEYDNKTAVKPEQYEQQFDRECAKGRKRMWQKRSRGLPAGRVGYPLNRNAGGRRNDQYPAR